jgi:Anti-sigma factor NepR
MTTLREKTMRETPDLNASPAAKLSSDIKVRVGQQLRVIYGDVMDQGVPDGCTEILKRLDDLTDGTRK